MPAKLNVKKLLEANPSVDAKKLAEALDVIAELKKAGIVVTSGYNLTIPFSKRVVQSDDSRASKRRYKR